MEFPSQQLKDTTIKLYRPIIKLYTFGEKRYPFVTHFPFPLFVFFTLFASTLRKAKVCVMACLATYGEPGSGTERA